jgi:predicted lipid-binding transport protein (Tim44 family)
MDSDLLITLIFAAIAVFVIVKLRSVLGTRTGFEKKPEPYAPRDSRDNVVPLPERRNETAPAAEPDRSPIAGTLAAIRRADANFDPDRFVDQAKMAFEMIVAAFAKGDEETLESLLSKPVFESFASAIRQRRAASETVETSIVNIRSASIKNAEIKGREAFVTMLFVSDQIKVTRDKDGKVIDGDPRTAETVSDLWTFTRDTRSPNPAWLLSETEVLEAN